MPAAAGREVVWLGERRDPDPVTIVGRGSLGCTLDAGFAIRRSKPGEGGFEGSGGLESATPRLGDTGRGDLLGDILGLGTVDLAHRGDGQRGRRTVEHDLAAAMPTMRSQ